MQLAGASRSTGLSQAQIAGTQRTALPRRCATGPICWFCRWCFLPHGAFIAIPAAKVEAAAAHLRAKGVVADARGGLLRLCPDILNSSHEIAEAGGYALHALSP